MGFWDRTRDPVRYTGLRHVLQGRKAGLVILRGILSTSTSTSSGGLLPMPAILPMPSAAASTSTRRPRGTKGRRKPRASRSGRAPGGGALTYAQLARQREQTARVVSRAAEITFELSRRHNQLNIEEHKHQQAAVALRQTKQYLFETQVCAAANPCSMRILANPCSLAPSFVPACFRRRPRCTGSHRRWLSSLALSTGRTQKRL